MHSTGDMVLTTNGFLPGLCWKALKKATPRWEGLKKAAVPGNCPFSLFTLSLPGSELTLTVILGSSEVRGHYAT